ncbi:hypothetical protein N7476_003853 [Penicillium atrosanguineum]|uniref:DUF7923 domain-containing protein n=1 Tax=Penicillium atrosanguineum TaxID=1132637 RepID=A0A9W9PZ52_9EURO|nr:hypothetical protein N7476_003853 [Penicillium atrosanguineum]
MIDVGELKQRYEAVRAIDNSKDTVIEELFFKVEQLRNSLKQEKDELEDQKRLVRDYKEDSKKNQDELRKMHEDQARLSYVSVLIDGDGMNFLDTLVQDGKTGGQEAAKLLKEAVQNHAQEAEPKPSSNVQYKIRVYANVRGLAKVYHRASIIDSEDVLESFIQGFNMENMLCDFVDVGKAKEGSDAKIRALFEYDLIDVHCLCIVFGSSGDNGYAHMLRPYRGSDRISLVEGPPFEQELKALKDGFRITSFGNHIDGAENTASELCIHGQVGTSITIRDKQWTLGIKWHSWKP